MNRTIRTTARRCSYRYFRHVRAKTEEHFKWEEYGKTRKHEDKTLTPRALRRRHEKDTVMEISLTPIGMDELTISRYITFTSNACNALGLKHEVTPMSTVVEGSMEDCLEAVRQAAESALESRTPRVIVHATLDIRPGEFGRFDRKRKRIRAVAHETGEKFDGSETEAVFKKG